MSKTHNKKTTGLIATALFVLALSFDLVVMFSSPIRTRGTVWDTADLWVTDSDFVPVACLFFVILFLANLAASVAGSVISLRAKKVRMWPSVTVVFSHALMLIINLMFNALRDTTWLIIALVISVVGVVFNFVCSAYETQQSEIHKKSESNILKKRFSLFGISSVVLMLSLLYVPLCSYKIDGNEFPIVAMGTVGTDEDRILALGLFVVLFVFTIINFIMLTSVFKHYSAEISELTSKIRNIVNLNTIITGTYFVLGVVVCSICNSEGGEYDTISYIPFLISVVLAVVFAFTSRNVADNNRLETHKTVRSARIEFFSFGTAISLVTVIASLSDILRVTFDNHPEADPILLNGYDVFMTYNSLEGGLQLVAFLLLAILCITIGLFVASLIALLSRSKMFFRITLAEIVSGAICSLIIGLFGKYYEIVQHLNKDVIESIIGKFGGSKYLKLEYTVTGQAFIWFLVAMAVLVVVLIRKPYSRGTVGETPVLVGNAASSDSVNLSEPTSGDGDVQNTNTEPNPVKKTDVDPCPAFSELDHKASLYSKEQERRKALAFQSPTLPELVQFVVNYARDCRLHLSYTPEDIATFIAGLGATRLTILQGMSGTGKTSLPKIFSEAILGNCEIIEVESSWRDKNELLGYYNEFSKTYTPKKFTQALYRAKLQSETVTFIVLDEMNLSRIEYYFSDFLSLMENEEDKREIKLLNMALNRRESGKTVDYLCLSDGHTLKIPNNIWFIGTANRDESTFEISDKVYDRAHTMNFNKRAPKPLAFGQPIPQRFISVAEFSKLLQNAKTTINFDIDNYPLIKEVEALLAPYNISFGNRIANQIESFVRIYCSCFMNPEIVLPEAVEKILLSKVVSKLEFKSIENKVELAAEFEKRKLLRCSEFILKLNED